MAQMCASHHQVRGCAGRILGLLLWAVFAYFWVQKGPGPCLCTCAGCILDPIPDVDLVQGGGGDVEKPKPGAGPPGRSMDICPQMGEPSLHATARLYFGCLTAMQLSNSEVPAVGCTACVRVKALCGMLDQSLGFGSLFGLLNAWLNRRFQFYDGIIADASRAASQVVFDADGIREGSVGGLSANFP